MKKALIESIIVRSIVQEKIYQAKVNATQAKQDPIHEDANILKSTYYRKYT
ncbi:MAG: hypothetical protein WDA24_08035 [Tissierellales bacterium]